MKHIEREVIHNDQKMKEKFKVWRLETEILRLRAIIDEYRTVLEMEVEEQDGEMQQ